MKTRGFNLVYLCNWRCGRTTEYRNKYGFCVVSWETQLAEPIIIMST